MHKETGFVNHPNSCHKCSVVVVKATAHPKIKIRNVLPLRPFKMQMSLFLYRKGLFHPKMKMMSLITYPHVVPNLEKLCSSLKQSKILWMKTGACDCPIDCKVNNTVKVQKSMKDHRQSSPSAISGSSLILRIYTVRLIQNSVHCLRPAGTL